jgi:hypothetical protein
MKSWMILCAMVIVGLTAFDANAQCGSGNSVDFGNADLGRQLCQGGNCNLSSVQTFEEVIPLQRVAMRQSASSSSASASALTQPGAYLTFQEGGMQPVPEMSRNSSYEASMMEELAMLREEVRQLRSARSSQPVFQTAAFQSGGASASSSAATSAPNVAQLALTNQNSARSSQSACSSGGCGGRSRGSLLGRRQVSRSRSFSSSTSR